MSIIISIVSNQCGITASDGRITGNVEFIDENAVTKAIPLNDSFNKTFFLDNRKIIGAWCGIMHIAGKTVSEHIQQIYSEDCYELQNLRDILFCLTTKIKEKLENDNSILFRFRKIDLIIVTSESGKIQDLRNYTYRFLPDTNSNKISIESKVTPYNQKLRGEVYFEVFGDDSARPFVYDYIKRSTNNSKDKNISLLKQIAINAIALGIKKSGIHPNGEHPTCGGKHFFLQYNPK